MSAWLIARAEEVARLAAEMEGLAGTICHGRRTLTLAEREAGPDAPPVAAIRRGLALAERALADVHDELRELLT